MGILAAPTFRSNRIAGCPLMADRDLNSLLRVLKGFDKKGAIVASTFSGVGASCTT